MPPKTVPVVTIDIDLVEPHPQNARVHDLESIKASLTRFGQTKPIIVQKATMHVVAGNGTRLAAKELGWETIQAKIVDFDDETAKAYLAADNRTSDRARYDAERLLGLLEGLEDLDGTGFDAEDVEVMGGVLQSVGMVGETPVSADSGALSPNRVKKDPTPREVREPMREVIMLMTVSDAAVFGEQVGALRKAYKAKSVVETVARAVAEACVAHNCPTKPEVEANPNQLTLEGVA